MHQSQLDTVRLFYSESFEYLNPTIRAKLGNRCDSKINGTRTMMLLTDFMQRFQRFSRASAFSWLRTAS